MVKALNISGLVLTLAGAIWSAMGVFITPEEAEGMTGAAIGTNFRMNALLVSQSHHAAFGLLLIGVGTILQLVAQFSDRK